MTIVQSRLRESMIEKIRNFFADKPVKKVWLFGSMARGDFNKSSDIDVLVAWDYSGIKTGMEYYGWWQDLEGFTGRKVDMVSEGYLSPYAVERVDADKILIYEKELSDN